MTGTETQIHEALTAVADQRPVDVERLWREFQAATEVTPPTRRSQHHWFVPLAAAAATLLVMGLVVVGRAHVGGGGHGAPANPGTEFSLDRLPSWPNGTSATTFPLPAPVSTPIAFDADTLSTVPKPGHWRVVVYYADDPSRLCVIQIFRPTTGAAHTMSIACEGESTYARTPVSRDLGSILGTVPPAATNVEVTADGKPADVEVVTRAGMPQPVFFAQFPDSTTVGGAASVRWRFVDADGRTVGQGPEENPTTPTQPTDNPTPYRATPVSDMATFDEPPSGFAPAGSRRILHIYWAGDTRGFCSKEEEIRPGKSPQTTSEDCGVSFSDQVTSLGQWLPASSSGSTTGETFWGIMPPGAIRTVIVTGQEQVPAQSKRATGMPTGVYAGSIAASQLQHSNPMYFLDADGHVIVAESWRSFSQPPSCHNGVCTYDDSGQ